MFFPFRVQPIFKYLFLPKTKKKIKRLLRTPYFTSLVVIFYGVIIFFFFIIWIHFYFARNENDGDETLKMLAGIVKQLWGQLCIKWVELIKKNPSYLLCGKKHFILILMKDFCWGKLNFCEEIKRVSSRRQKEISTNERSETQIDKNK